jgi:hypothetical protein
MPKQPVGNLPLKTLGSHGAFQGGHARVGVGVHDVDVPAPDGQAEVGRGVYVVPKDDSGQPQRP